MIWTLMHSAFHYHILMVVVQFTGLLLIQIVKCRQNYNRFNRPCSTIIVIINRVINWILICQHICEMAPGLNGESLEAESLKYTIIFLIYPKSKKVLELHGWYKSYRRIKWDIATTWIWPTAWVSTGGLCYQEGYPI